MGTVTFKDYTAAIKRQYEDVKSGNHSGFLLVPTTSQLRAFCLYLFDSDLSVQDENAFRLFFKANTEDHLRKCIENFDVEKFRPVKNFLVGKSESTNLISLNLIAIMVNFEPRPLTKFLKHWNGVGVVNKQKETALSSLISIKSLPAAGAKLIYKKIAMIAGIAVLFIGGGYAGMVCFPVKGCMQWNNDHYEEVICEKVKIGQPEISPIDPDQLYLKEILVSDTTTFFRDGKPLVWYGKHNKVCEYFNAPGNHPETGKQLRPISKYIIGHHILKKN